MRMLADYVLISPETRAEQKIGSIVLPDSTEKGFTRGTVMEVGPGCFLPNGQQMPADIRSGDKVLYFKETACPVIVDNRDMHIVQERNIIGVFDRGDTEAPEREKIKNLGVGFGE